MTAPHDAALERFENSLAPQAEARPELTLFVSGASDISARAIANARRLCDVGLEGRYDLSVVDVHQDPSAARDIGMIAAPTLVRKWPLPVRKFVGDLSRIEKVVLALELPPKALEEPG